MLRVAETGPACRRLDNSRSRAKVNEPDFGHKIESIATSQTVVTVSIMFSLDGVYFVSEMH